MYDVWYTLKLLIRSVFYVTFGNKGFHKIYSTIFNTKSASLSSPDDFKAQTLHAVLGNSVVFVLSTWKSDYTYLYFNESGIILTIWLKITMIQLFLRFCFAITIYYSRTDFS